MSGSKEAHTSTGASNAHGSSDLRIKGSPLPASVWDAQYCAGGWDYLESEDELGHYLAICALYQRYLHGRTVLDIGCGMGTLYRHLVERTGLQPSLYAGKDLSESALNLARNRFREASFERCDYSIESIDLRFGCVVFNETLYCFDDPVGILKKGTMQNLEDGGLVIVSMYGDHHDPLWQAIAAYCATVDERIVENSQQVRWRVRALKPLI